MRAKLAVVIAVAVVFAPGWGAERFAGETRSSVDVGARMLAPTFAQAAERTTFSAQKRLARHSPSAERSKLVGWGPTGDSPNLPLGLILAISLAIYFFHPRQDPRPRPGRAPPHPLTV